MQFDWKALEKSMDAVDKAVTTHEHADPCTKNSAGWNSECIEVFILETINNNKAWKKAFQASSDSQAAALEHLHNVTYPRLIKKWSPFPDAMWGLETCGGMLLWR